MHETLTYISLVDIIVSKTQFITIREIYISDGRIQALEHHEYYCDDILDLSRLYCQYILCDVSSTHVQKCQLSFASFQALAG